MVAGSGLGTVTEVTVTVELPLSLCSEVKPLPGTKKPLENTVPTAAFEGIVTLSMPCGSVGALATV